MRRTRSAFAGRRADPAKILDQLGDISKRKYVAAAPVARIYAGLEKKDKAFEWMEKAYDERALTKVDPRFDPLRSDPRFADLLRRMNLPK